MEQPQIRFGKWQSELADLQCDALIFDAPYSVAPVALSRNDGYETAGLAADYAEMTPALVREFCESWAPRCRGWMVSLTDYDLSQTWRDEMERVGRYAFRQPVPCVIRAMSVRAQNDGPSSWTLYAMVSRSRTREFADWGVLDGAYVGGTEGHGRAGGTERSGGRGKPQWLMRALVRDYSRPGDLVCDPFAGWGSTLVAAAGLGRRAIGAECDPNAHAEATKRLARPLQVEMFAGGAA